MILVIAGLIGIVLMIAAGMYEGFRAWAEERANERAEELYRRYVEGTTFQITPRFVVEYRDETGLTK